MAESIDYLIPMLRLKIGDLDSTTYKYLDEWLLNAFIAAIRGLERYWDSKYFITDGGIVTRNTNYNYFEFEETEGTIQSKDEDIIVIKAALIILEGGLENAAWNIGSWRDAEISYSNLEYGRLRTENIRRMREELSNLIKVPMKRLTTSQRMTILDTKV